MSWDKKRNLSIHHCLRSRLWQWVILRLRGTGCIQGVEYIIFLMNGIIHCSVFYLCVKNLPSEPNRGLHCTFVFISIIVLWLSIILRTQLGRWSLRASSLFRRIQSCFELNKMVTVSGRRDGWTIGVQCGAADKHSPSNCFELTTGRSYTFGSRLGYIMRCYFIVTECRLNLNVSVDIAFIPQRHRHISTWVKRVRMIFPSILSYNVYRRVLYAFWRLQKEQYRPVRLPTGRLAAAYVTITLIINTLLWSLYYSLVRNTLYTVRIMCGFCAHSVRIMTLQ